MTITDGTWLVIFGFCIGVLVGAFVGSLFQAASGEEKQDNEQTGMQAGVPAAQTGDGGSDKQKGSAEGGGDLQAEAIRSSERPTETEENR